METPLTQLCSHFIYGIGHFEFVTSKQQKEALKVTVWVSLPNLALSAVSLQAVPKALSLVHTALPL